MTGVVLPVDGGIWWPSAVCRVLRPLLGPRGRGRGLCCSAFRSLLSARPQPRLDTQVPRMSSATPASASHTADNGVAGTAAFSKFMRVLQWVADNPEPVGIAEIAKATGFPRPTVHRIVAALTAERLLVEIGATRSWTLGHRLVQLASRSWSRSPAHAARATPCALRDETGETVHLAVPSGLCMVYIENWKVPARCRWPRASAPACLHSTAVGKAYLAALAPDAAEPLLGQIGYERQTPQTIADAAALRKQLLDARLRLVHGRAGERAGHPLLRRGGARCRWPACGRRQRQHAGVPAEARHPGQLRGAAAARSGGDRPAPGRESQPWPTPDMLPPLRPAPPPARA